MDTKKIRFVANSRGATRRALEAGPDHQDTARLVHRSEVVRPGPATGKPAEAPNGGGKMPTWKACPAVLDVLGHRVHLQDAVRHRVRRGRAGNIQARVLDAAVPKLSARARADAAIRSSGRLSPKALRLVGRLGRGAPRRVQCSLDAPTQSLRAAVLDDERDRRQRQDPPTGHDAVLLASGRTGILRAGTPYAQIIPFKREHWVSEIDVSLTAEQISAKSKENVAKYRKPDGGVYQRDVWERRNYQ